MSFDIKATEPFERKLKRLKKKYKSIKTDLARIITKLTVNPRLGISLGKDCYKIRLAIASKSQGKSGGARLITCVKVTKKTVYLLDIYDKSDKSSLSDNELKILIEILAD